MKRKLRLFVWEDVLTDWTSGVMFALAHDVDEARRLIDPTFDPSKDDQKTSDLKQEPSVYDSPIGFAVWGGG